MVYQTCKCWLNVKFVLDRLCLGRGGVSTVVEHWPDHPKVKGLSPTSAGDKMAKKCLKANSFDQNILTL